MTSIVKFENCKEGLVGSRDRLVTESWRYSRRSAQDHTGWVCSAEEAVMLTFSKQVRDRSNQMGRIDRSSSRSGRTLIEHHKVGAEIAICLQKLQIRHKRMGALSVVGCTGAGGIHS